MLETWSNPECQDLPSSVSESPPVLTCSFFSGSATENQPPATWTLRSSPTTTKDQAPHNFLYPRSYKASRRNLECHSASKVKKQEQWLGEGPGFCNQEHGNVERGTLALFLVGISSHHPRAPRACVWLDLGRVVGRSLSTIISCVLSLRLVALTTTYMLMAPKCVFPALSSPLSSIYSTTTSLPP